jgi:hypothetical protein
VAGICRLTNVSFTVSKKLNDTSELDLFENTHATVNGNVNVDHAVLNMSSYASHSPASISIDGNVTVVGGDFNVGDDSPDGTSPVTVHVGGNFTADGAYNIIFYDGPVIAGRVNISDDHSFVTFERATLGPVSISNFDDPNSSVFIAWSTIEGSVDVTGVADGFTELEQHTIHGSLRCSGDSPAHTNGGVRTPSPAARPGGAPVPGSSRVRRGAQRSAGHLFLERERRGTGGASASPPRRGHHLRTWRSKMAAEYDGGAVGTGVGLGRLHQGLHQAEEHARLLRAPLGPGEGVVADDQRQQAVRVDRRLDLDDQRRGSQWVADRVCERLRARERDVERLLLAGVRFVEPGTERLAELHGSLRRGVETQTQGWPLDPGSRPRHPTSSSAMSLGPGDARSGNRESSRTRRGRNVGTMRAGANPASLERVIFATTAKVFVRSDVFLCTCPDPVTSKEQGCARETHTERSGCCATSSPPA